MKKKKFLTIFALCMFAIMMMLNVTTTINGDNFSIDGYVSLVNGSTGCYQPGGPCCPVWDVEYNPSDGTIKCYTGGSYNCINC